MRMSFHYFFLFFILVWLPKIECCNTQETIDGLTGNQLPPPDSAYRDYFHKCGIVNECKDSGVGCKRKKRSILKLKKSNFSSNSPQGEDYITGGTDQPDYKYPWVGRLVSREAVEQKSNEAVCTVSLISSRHVITAKHCFKYDVELKYNATTIPPRGALGVDFGPNRVREMKDLHEIREIFVPIQQFGSAHDIAVALIYEVKFTDKLRPICLPIYGMPGSTKVDFVGYGHAGTYTSLNPLKPTSFLRKKGETKEKLQKLTDLQLTKKLTEQPQKVTKANKEVFLDNPYGSIKTSFFQITFDAGDQQICGGDSGGPLMWKNPKTQKYVILGVAQDISATDYKFCLRDEPTVAHRANFGKISLFLPEIVKYLVGGEHNVCMDPFCRGANPDGLTKRTWLATVTKTAGETYQTLSAPCFYHDGIGVDANPHPSHVCPIDLDGYRNLDIGRVVAGRNELWRPCSPCPKPDWDSSHLLDEITAGSMSQERYTGIEAPTIAAEYFSDRKNHLPSHDVCEIDAESGNTYTELITCPQYKFLGAPDKQCLLPQNICDGHEDCYDGWDESPHLCIGKCDFFYQYQQSTYNYKGVSNVQGHVVSSAKECLDNCVADQLCTYFNWFGGDKGQSKIKICETFAGQLSNKIAENNGENTLIKNTIRGPRQCIGPRDPEDHFTCTPTKGVPYRSGFFFIQAKTGHFLETGNWSTDSKINEVVFSPRELSQISKKSLWLKTSNGVELSFNEAEWIFIFHAEDTMAKSWFLIQSGYTNGTSQPAMYLTGNRNSIDVQEKINNFGDGSNSNQKWFIEQATPGRGFLEVKIYTKLANGNRYIASTSPADDIDGYNFEYTSGADLHQYKLELEGKCSPNESNKLCFTQVFRLFECDHGLLTGSSIRGIKRKINQNKQSGIDTKLQAAFDTLSVKDKNFIEGSMLRILFGISNIRYAAAKLHEIAFENLLKTISKAFAESDSLLDYAGRMRLSESEYKTLRKTWIDGHGIDTSSVNFAQEVKDLWKIVTDLRSLGYVH